MANRSVSIIIRTGRFREFLYAFRFQIIRIGRDEERVLIARKLHQGFECLTAASFAVELAKEQSERQYELVSRASKLLDEAAHLLGEVLKDKNDDTPRRWSAPERTSKDPDRHAPSAAIGSSNGQIKP